MRSTAAALFLGALAKLVSGEAHQLIVGTFGTDALYTVEFDDEALTLDLVKTTNTTTASSWIGLSHDKKNLYGTAFNADIASFVSYSLVSGTDIVYNTSVPLGGNCSTSKTIFVTGATEPPYNVYGTPFGTSSGGSADCGAVIAVDSQGVLSEVVQNYTYSSSSGVHGLAINKASTYLYSADDSANTLWTHSISNGTGKLTLVNSQSGPATGSDPRHVAVHPDGKYLYLLLEGANAVGVYSLDEFTGIPTFTNITYSLIPSGASDSSYWSDEVAVSSSGDYLWATSRARSTNSTGYISAFSLDANGAITKQLFLNPTTSSGGTANSVAPSDFSDKWIALTDSASGFVEIWTIASNGSAAEVVAHLDIDDGGCCANAVWYS